MAAVGDDGERGEEREKKRRETERERGETKSTGRHVIVVIVCVHIRLIYICGCRKGSCECARPVHDGL